MRSVPPLTCPPSFSLCAPRYGERLDRRLTEKQISCKSFAYLQVKVSTREVFLYAFREKKTICATKSAANRQGWLLSTPPGMPIRSEWSKRHGRISWKVSMNMGIDGPVCCRHSKSMRKCLGRLVHGEIRVLEFMKTKYKRKRERGEGGLRMHADRAAGILAVERTMQARPLPPGLHARPKMNLGRLAQCIRQRDSTYRRFRTCSLHAGIVFHPRTYGGTFPPHVRTEFMREARSCMLAQGSSCALKSPRNIPRTNILFSGSARARQSRTDLLLKYI